MSTKAPPRQVEPRLFDDELADPKRAARLIGVSESTLERMRGLGTGPPYIKLGPGKRARVAYRRRDIEHWLDAHTHHSTSEYGRR